MVAADTLPTTVVAAQMQVFLDDFVPARSYREALIATLAVPGGPLSDTPTMRWARLVCMCCTAAGGPWRQAVPVAAAAELFMGALDLLDDLEDEEEHPVFAVLGSARALNVSTGLLFLAQRAVLTTAGASAAGILLTAGLSACGGQHTDLTPTADHCIGLDGALNAAARKSASLVAALCRLGALAAAAREETLALHGEFGWYLGLSRQLANDLAAASPDATGKTDCRLGRPTLPLIFAAGYPREQGDDVGATADAFTWTVAETYRLRALALVPQLTLDRVSRKELERLVAPI